MPKHTEPGSSVTSVQQLHKAVEFTATVSYSPDSALGRAQLAAVCHANVSDCSSERGVQMRSLHTTEPVGWSPAVAV